MEALAPTHRLVITSGSATADPVNSRGAGLARRAQAIWPRLDRRALARCAGDPARITRLVARRTSLPPAVIRAILDPGLSEVDQEFWFG